MKNSEEFLSAELRGQLTPEQIRIIDGMQFGSRLTLKEKVHEAAMQMYQQNQKRNPADGGDGGDIFIAAGNMGGFTGKILSNGGDAGPGGKPGRGGNVAIHTGSMNGRPTIEAKGGKHLATPEAPKITGLLWGFILGLAAIVGTVFTVLQYYK